MLRSHAGAWERGNVYLFQDLFESKAWPDYFLNLHLEHPQNKKREKCLLKDAWNPENSHGQVICARLPLLASGTSPPPPLRRRRGEAMSFPSENDTDPGQGKFSAFGRPFFMEANLPSSSLPLKPCCSDRPPWPRQQQRCSRPLPLSLQHPYV